MASGRCRLVQRVGRIALNVIDCSVKRCMLRCVKTMGHQRWQFKFVKHQESWLLTWRAGGLQVLVIKGRNLRKADVDGLCDPFVVLKMGQIRAKTAVKKR